MSGMGSLDRNNMVDLNATVFSAWEPMVLSPVVYILLGQDCMMRKNVG
jgi:hypothetical protein